MAPKIPLFLGGSIIYGTSIIAGYVYMNGRNPPADHGKVTISDAERHKAFASNATKYDQEIGLDESLMGLNLLRWWHLRNVKGKVLEIGCGTGRNFSYYPTDAQVIAIDSVPEMLQQAVAKIPQNANIRLKVMNAHSLQFNGQFDVVIDTFGLCSYDDPVAVLKEMSRVCKTNGRLLLIEHGKGSYEWINNIIDKDASHHAHTWGCTWNRDIGELLKQAGVEVVSVSRWHFGTTYVIEAKPAAR